MAPALDQFFKHRHLIHEPVLIAQEMCQAAVIVLDRTDWLALGLELLALRVLAVDSLLKEDHLQSLCFAV